MRIAKFRCLNVANGANANSTSMDMGGMSLGAFEVLTTGTLAGTAQLQYSVTGDNWADYGSAVVISAATAVVIPFSAFGPAFIRLAWTATGGAGGVQAWANAKSGTV